MDNTLISLAAFLVIGYFGERITAGWGFEADLIWLAVLAVVWLVVAGMQSADRRQARDTFIKAAKRDRRERELNQARDALRWHQIEQQNKTSAELKRQARGGSSW